MFFRLTTWDLVRFMWWSLWNPEPALPKQTLTRQEAATANFKVIYGGASAMAPETHCPTCRRPY